MKHTIHACMDDDITWIKKSLEEKGIDTSKCTVCSAEIVATEVDAYYLMDRIRRWLGNPKKFYTWNIGAITPKGFVCEKFACFSDVIYSGRVKL